MDTTTTLGSVLALVGVLAGVVVAYLGKRGETALTGYTRLTDDLQEERTALRQELTELYAFRAADQAEIARLRIENADLRGQRP